MYIVCFVKILIIILYIKKVIKKKLLFLSNKLFLTKILLYFCEVT